MANARVNWGPIRLALAIRAGNRCEGCGKPFDPHPVYGFSVSHRLPRGSGIKDDSLHSLSNLTLFCGQGSEKDTCHGKCKSEFDRSLHKGWIISRFDKRKPSEIPILFPDGWYLLTDSGERIFYD